MKIFNIDFSAIACSVRKQVVLMIASLALMIIFKYFILKDTAKRAFGEAFALLIISIVIWLASNRINAWYDCKAVISRSCEKILSDAKDNGCTLNELPKVVYI
jgi:hypothetical protein